jgi:hypothetical protein
MSVRLWHDPAHVLVGIFADQQAKPFGAFLTQKRHWAMAPAKPVDRASKNRGQCRPFSVAVHEHVLEYPFAGQSIDSEVVVNTG